MAKDEDYERVHEDRFWLHKDRLDGFRSYLEVHRFPGREGEVALHSFGAGFTLSEGGVGHFCFEHDFVDDPADLDDVVECAEKVAAALQNLAAAVRAYQRDHPLTTEEKASAE